MCNLALKTGDGAGRSSAVVAAADGGGAFSPYPYTDTDGFSTASPRGTYLSGAVARDTRLSVATGPGRSGSRAGSARGERALSAVRARSVSPGPSGTDDARPRSLRGRSPSVARALVLPTTAAATDGRCSAPWAAMAQALVRRAFARVAGDTGAAAACAQIVGAFCAPWLTWRSEEAALADIHPAKLAWRPTVRRDALESAMTFVVAEPSLLPAPVPTRVVVEFGGGCSDAVELWCVHESSIKAAAPAASSTSTGTRRPQRSAMFDTGASARAQPFGISARGRLLGACASGSSDGAVDICSGVVAVDVDNVDRAIRFSTLDAEGSI
eukprot:CAMPEP_0174837586 /NCGR_PEP_ID=MMETSP1114-20130205/6838_1 /TAXON_ID=312471 /ORGANISM="Neobodo designis, Strain CCAP 1951/1" /LENGTH=325 /DNA_ID=CAMNT_0016071653 /DNA_START=240 /DNA_END=1214 /DNA_ORIENTATION=+